MIRNWTEATPWEYERAVFLAGDFWRETSKELGMGAILWSFEHKALVEGIRQKGLQKRKNYPEDKRRVASYHNDSLNIDT